MNKTRLENLTDGVFAIVMTLLVIEIKVPEVHGPLVEALADLTPLFISYFLSFAVLSAFWLSHHGLFHLFIRTINRPLIQLNILYLSFISLIPFSAHLLGSHPHEQFAVMWYGANILLAGLGAVGLFCYAIQCREIENVDFSKRMMRQAAVRYTLYPTMAVLGIAASFVSIPAAIILYLVPVIINAIPGSLNFLEKLLRFRIPE
ncbi:MAG TPA: TMEM175 family protein [Candidatus Paceibacterota bacterium]